MRIALALLCAVALGAAAAFIASVEKPLTTRRQALREFDARAREASAVLADLRTAQQAYVAVGQGTDFWMPKVDALAAAVGTSLTALQQSTVSATAKSALEEAAAALKEFGDVDHRIRGYLASGAQLMAADIVFTEGGEAAANAARDVERARLEEHVAFDSVEGTGRRQQLTAAAAATGFAMVAILVLAFMPKRTADAPAATSMSLKQSPTPAPTGDDLPLRHAESDSPPSDAPPARLPESQKQAELLKSAAQLCTDIGRVADVGELKTLLERAAAMLDASGLLLWLANNAGTELRPALAHGYAAQTVARIPAVPRSADNAAAAAYRTGTLQIVLSRPGSSAKGAIVAPVFSVDGCAGVLSAEIRNGGEATDATQALAALIAAQLGGVCTMTAESDEQAPDRAAL